MPQISEMFMIVFIYYFHKYEKKNIFTFLRNKIIFKRFKMYWHESMISYSIFGLNGKPLSEQRQGFGIQRKTIMPLNFQLCSISKHQMCILIIK